MKNVLSQKREELQKNVFLAMGGYNGEHEIQKIVSDKAEIVSSIDFFQKKINELQVKMEESDNNTSYFQFLKIQKYSKASLKALRDLLKIIEEEDATAC